MTACGNGEWIELDGWIDDWFGFGIVCSSEMVCVRDGGHRMGWAGLCLWTIDRIQGTQKKI